MKVLHSSGARELLPQTLQRTDGGTVVNTEEWNAYSGLTNEGRVHRTVCHEPGKRQWARDDEGDGVREVHNHTLEGLWTGLRNFLRAFRGVHKKYLEQYIAVFEWAHNLKTATVEFVSLLLGPRRPLEAPSG